MIKKQMRRTDDIPTVKKIGLAYDAILDVINDDEVSQKSWPAKNRIPSQSFITNI